MKVESLSSPEDSIIDYELDMAKDDSEYQVLWSTTMDKGSYKNPSTYKKIEALLLCWSENSDDLATKGEVKRLKSVFEDRFKFNARIDYLDNHNEKRLQVQVNEKVAVFVGNHDGPNTLLIVYYAGHGRPGDHYGSLELFGQTAPNDAKKRRDSLVWNHAEELLRPAEADVLELFDCCYAGNLALTRGEHRAFEYLAATRHMHKTPGPGDESFTSALIWALETLLEEKKEGRFTTVELLNKIKSDAPHFPKDQDPILSDRKDSTSAGRIMLHPLQRVDSAAHISPKEFAPLDLSKRQTITLHFDFSEKPSTATVEKLGLELNGVFERNTLGVNLVRWGAMQSRESVVALAARSLLAPVIRNRRKSVDQRRAGERHAHNPTGLLIPPVSTHCPSQKLEVTVNNNLVLPGPGPGSPALFTDSDEGSVDQDQRHHKRHRLH